jgi:hypothetical protein
MHMEVLQDQEKVEVVDPTKEALVKAFCQKCMRPADPSCEICNGYPGNFNSLLKLLWQE